MNWGVMYLLYAFLGLILVDAETPAERAEYMLQQMNSTEKLQMLHGHKGMYIGNIVGNNRLGIPSLNMHDGPQGFRVTETTKPEGSTTAWPSALSAAASWDSDLIYRWSAAMAKEFKIKGANVQLAPGIGIARVPNAGRNFEYLSGEDPVVGATLVVAAVKGIQDQGVIANAKHWINNEIEDKRMLVSANVDERTRFEFYYPPFDAAVRAGVLSIMCSYNLINDVYSCQNPDTLSHLRNTLGFEGWVMSDWTATHSTVESLNAGLTQEMPVGVFYREDKVQEALDTGKVTMDTIDDHIRRVLTAMYAIGLFDHANEGDRNAIATSEEHNLLTREIAAKSTVLLKNDIPVGSAAPLLPLQLRSDMKCIAAIGDNSTVSGTGSGHVQPAYLITPAEGIASALAAAGFDDLEVKYVDGLDFEAAALVATECDFAVVSVATTCGEGSDRETLALGNGQDDLVNAVLAANANTVVSVVAPGPVLMPWAKEVSAILMSWLPGQEAGNALADVLFGVVTPSARLHVTMPNKDNEVGFTNEQYPGVGFPHPQATYSEGLFVGYRYYEAHQITPNFCFGHGLSYTTFSYDDLQQLQQEDVSEDGPVVRLSVDVTNTGKVDADEIVQLYISFPSCLEEEPPKQLKRFQKVRVKAAQTVTVLLEVTERDVSIWNSDSHSWDVVQGTFAAFVGPSSCNIQQQLHFEIA